MTGFLAKDLDDHSIGDTLRAAREGRGESFEEVEHATRVGKKYVAALEAGDLKKLPEPIYAKKFVMALAKHYGLDPRAAADSLLKELAVVGGLPASRHPVNFVEGRSLVVAPMLFRTVAFSAAFLAIILYFAFSVRNILKPPTITLYSPRDGQVFLSNRVVLEGLTQPEVDLTVNGEIVPIEANGYFKDVLNLPPGVSHLRLAAKKKHSHEQEILLKVMVEAPKETGSATGTVEKSATTTE